MSSNEIIYRDDNSDADNLNCEANNLNCYADISTDVKVDKNDESYEIQFKDLVMNDDTNLSICSFTPNIEDAKDNLEINENYPFEISFIDELKEKNTENEQSGEIDKGHNGYDEVHTQHGEINEEYDIMKNQREVSEKNDDQFEQNVEKNDNYHEYKLNDKDVEPIDDLISGDNEFENNNCDNSSNQDEHQLANINDMWADNRINIQFEDNSLEIANDYQLISTENKEEINSDDISEKSKIVKKFEIKAAVESTCDICTKRVYPMEKLSMDNKCYHKTCFKCCKCGKSLNTSVVSKFNNNIFCKTHYIELFLKRGRYDDINVSNSEDTAITYKHETIASNHKKDVQNTLASDDCVTSSKEVTEDSGVFSPEETVNRVADARKAWSEGRVMNNTEWKKGNSNNSNQVNELQSMNSNVKVKNLTAIFESNQ